jgi:aminoglycoside phosphotransferase (APT) family kinase protein
MDHRQPLTIDEVEGAARPLLGGRASARLLEAKHRNRVFAIGEEAIFKAYLCDGVARQARKVAALGFLEDRGLPVPRLLGHGVLPKGPSGVPWTLETGVVADHVRPTRAELNTPQSWEFHRELGRWLPILHAFDGFPCFGTWDASGPATLPAHVLSRARTVRAQTAGLQSVPPTLLRRAGQELDRLEPAIRAADRLRPKLLHGDYGSSNVAVGRTADGRVGVVAVFDFESAAPGDPVEDFLWTADHGLESRIFRSYVAGYLEQAGWTPTRPSGSPAASRSTAWTSSAGPVKPTRSGSRRRSGSSSRCWTVSACGWPDAAAAASSPAADPPTSHAHHASSANSPPQDANRPSVIPNSRASRGSAGQATPRESG